MKILHTQIEIQGRVQGVGFRPFIARLAQRFVQNGWIRNNSTGVTIAIEGLENMQQAFLQTLQTELPPFAKIDKVNLTVQSFENFKQFEILPSLCDTSLSSALTLPDIATCAECVIDIFNIQSRYYRYPFTSCCSCGVRYSITTLQPYDRANTSMAEFVLCADCEYEYQSMDNRRFHAQTIACPTCGVQLSFWNSIGEVLAEKDAALKMAVKQLKEGKIIALKGIGGYQLLVDATQQEAVERLRERKKRPAKPFALMVKDVATARTLCQISAEEETALCLSAAPIVLLSRTPQTIIVDAVAPQQALLGVMLAYSPLHHLLLHDFDLPLVVTSGNRQNEPICIDNKQALKNLSDIADFFLVHNRAILRPLDDSIVRIINHKITVLRRSRGFAPLPITINKALPNILAVGGQMKNTVAITHNEQVILSQHIGDLDSELTALEFQTTLENLQNTYHFKPYIVVHDLHTDYVSTQFAEHLNIEKYAVQHHYAHALSCIAENTVSLPALGIIWDGTGLGLDGTLWGGEFLLIHAQGFQRFAHFRTFPLVGASKAIQEPRRAALGILFEIYGDDVFEKADFNFSNDEKTLLKMMLSKQLNCPKTSSIGRIFDAVSSLLELCHVNHYEGHAAMLLESCATISKNNEIYDFKLSETLPIIIDWQIMFEQLLQDKKTRTTHYCAAKFHNTLAAISVTIALKAKQKNIVLSGGCFQNALLVEKVFTALPSTHFSVHCHQQVPPNDGGLALGQILATQFK